MSDTSAFGFEKLVPGFDFLQNLVKGASGGMPSMPSLSHWVAPTVNVEELDKRIQELKAVQFWLEQNARALTATIQALEVQKMTLATLHGMNVSMGDVAKAFSAKPASQASAPPAAPAAAPAATPAPSSVPPAPEAAATDAATETPAAGAMDPMQWWGALTSQFQQIAATALDDVAKQAAAARTAASRAPAGAADVSDAVKGRKASAAAPKTPKPARKAPRSSPRSSAAQPKTAKAPARRGKAGGM